VFDSAGKRIANGCADGRVLIWDVQTRAEIACLRGHRQLVDSVSFSPDGRRLASKSSKEGIVRVWDTHTGECLETIQGSGEVEVIAAGPPKYPWRALIRGQETVIEVGSSGTAVAWFPTRLEDIATHPSGREWAGVASNHLYLIRLEGDLNPDESSTHPQSIGHWNRWWRRAVERLGRCWARPRVYDNQRSSSTGRAITVEAIWSCGRPFNYPPPPPWNH
jgi:WD40 repeat protein